MITALWRACWLGGGGAILAAAVVAGCASSSDREPAPPPVAEPRAEATDRSVVAETVAIPDEVILDQTGEDRRFYTDLVEGRTVAIGFFFTTCTTICPPLTATMAQVQDQLRARGREEIHLISVSIDPTTDTPERLRAWAKSFGADPGWTFVTGEKARVDKVLKALEVYVARAEDHAPILLVGNDRAGVWRREYALAPATDLVEQILKIDALSPAPPPAGAADGGVGDPSATDREEAGSVAAAPDGSAEPSFPVNEAAHRWFTDQEIVDQNGVTRRLYSDLIQGRTVIVNCFFSTCTGICPVMNSNLREIQAAFLDRMGKDLFIVSISVDPEVDTPERLAEFAEGLRAGPGWTFLTGTREQVDVALHKFGLTTDVKENHKGLFLIGNDRTGLWEKAMGLGQAAELIGIVDRVLHDEENPVEVGPPMPSVRRTP